MSFTLKGKPVLAVLAGVGLGSVTGFALAATGAVDFDAGIFGDKAVTGVAYGATVGAVPGALIGMSKPQYTMEELAEMADKKEITELKKSGDKPSKETQETPNIPRASLSDDEAQDFEDFRQWKALMRGRQGGDDALSDDRYSSSAENDTKPSPRLRAEREATGQRVTIAEDGHAYYYSR